MSALDDLPEEVLAKVATYLGERVKTGLTYHHRVIKRAGLLAFRCASKACGVAVRRAAKDHVMTKSLTLGVNSTTQSIAACGRVIGSGCRELTIEVNSTEALPALRHFVVETTGGRLTQLLLHGSSSTGTLGDYDYTSLEGISANTLLEMCRTCPLLTDIEVFQMASVTGSDEDRERFAAELGRACQQLTYVHIGGPDFQLSQAECYPMHFPRIEQLELCGEDGGHGPYEPRRYDRIEATATACVEATYINMSGCLVEPQLVDVLLRTPLTGCVKTLDLGQATEITPETLLRCVAGFDALSEVRLPDHISADPEFYASLARARPTLTSIDMGYFTEAGDECVRTVVEELALESVFINHMKNLTPAVIDIILQSRSAQTLQYADIYMTPVFTSANMLNFVRGCPRLANTYWNQKVTSPIYDGPNVDKINALLMARGSEWGEMRDCFRRYGPMKRPAGWSPEPTVPASPSLFTPVAFADASREMIEELTAPDVIPQSTGNT